MQELKDVLEEFRKLEPRGYGIPSGEAFMVCNDDTIWGADGIEYLLKQAFLAGAEYMASKSELKEEDIKDVHNFEWDDAGRRTSAREFAGGGVYGYNRAIEGLKNKSSKVLEDIKKEM
jgi:hypothetical protein